MLEEPETLDTELLQEEEAEAEKSRPGLTMFTDGSRLDDGAAGYAVVWKNGQSWVGIKTHMGYNQEACDAECAAIAGALETASRRQTTPERVAIFTDAQAAIRRMALGGAWPRPDVRAPGEKAHRSAGESQAGHHHRDRSAHKGIPGNEKADEWAKLAAEEPDARGVEWLSYSDRTGARATPSPGPSRT